MDKAVTYIQNRRSYLSTYLEDGRCSFSNNLSENAIRPFTVGRKNWLFCDTPNGAQASAIVYTMVEMAKANGVNVYHYLTYLLEKLPDDRMSDDELELLAPWNETIKAEDQAEYEAAYGAVSISAAQDSYHTDEDKFYFALSNGTDYSLFHGGKEFQYCQDGIWYIVPAAPGVEFPAPEYELPAMETMEERIGLKSYIPLSPGTYRILITFLGNEAAPPYNDDFTIGYTFEVL